MMFRFKHEPYAHQLQALGASWDKDEFALFLEMGTGKSKILIDNLAILYDKGKINAALIIAPKGVYRNWSEKELPEHMPDHVLYTATVWNPATTKKNLEYLEQAFAETDDLKILVMNIEALRTQKGHDFAASFLRAHTALMAVDESTTIKNRKALQTRSATKLGKAAKYRRILTGSPITKSPVDLYSQCEYLDPFLLGFSSFWTFQNRYCHLARRQTGNHVYNQVIGYQNLEELSRSLERFSFRVTKEQCLDLPEKIYLKRTVELTPEQRKAYDQMRLMALAEIDNKLVTTTNALTTLLRLQQICSGSVRMDDGSTVPLPTNKMGELLSCLEEVDGKVIIWANFTHDIVSIENELARVYGKQAVASYYGATPDGERQGIVKSFQSSGDLRFFIGQPRTGGYGLTLTAANTVVYYSNGYDLEVRLQSEDRAHRIGQRRSVTYVDIVAERTVDEKILKALRAKMDIAGTILKEEYKSWLL